MLVNMLTVKNRQMHNLTTGANGTFASFRGMSVSFSGIFASNLIYGSPASVSTP